MSNIRLVEPPEVRFSWANEILSLEIGDKFKTKKKYGKTISPLISRDIKYREPEREFETDSKSEPQYFIVERKN